MSIDNNKMLEIYRKLLLARLFEERVYKLVLEGLVIGSVHLSTGEEAALGDPDSSGGRPDSCHGVGGVVQRERFLQKNRNLV